MAAHSSHQDQPPTEQIKGLALIEAPKEDGSANQSQALSIQNGTNLPEATYERDLRMFTQNVDCKFYYKREFLKLFSKTLYIFHANIEGNLGKLVDFVTALDVKPDIVCVSETQKKADAKRGVVYLSDKVLPGYRYYSMPCSCGIKSPSGGVGIFVKKSIETKVVAILNHENEIVQTLNNVKTDHEDKEHTKSDSIWLKLKHHNQELIVAAVYRHKIKVTAEVTIEQFATKLKNVIETLSLRTFVLGDINVSLNKLTTNKKKPVNAEHILKMLEQTEGRLLIDQPTSSTSGNIIDHIYDFNYPVDPQKQIKCGVVKTTREEISDHYGIFCKAEL